LHLLKMIETQMDCIPGRNLFDRWQSGRLLIHLRCATRHDPLKGKLTTVAAILKVNARELNDRIRIAETYRTAAEFKKAARHCRTWIALLDSLPR